VKRIIIGLLPLLALSALSARADNFGRVFYDRKNNQLVVTMIYRGTNPNHDFTLKWGECHAGQAGLQEVTAEVLDDQFQDRAQQNFRATKNFPLDGLPCRPAKVTLRTAPRFFYTLTIPG
jgi:hypothetical protein